MAVPKRRMSRANTRARRSQWKSDNVALQEIKVGGRVYNVPRRIAKAAQLGLVDVDKF
ncbi:50S ribosomal protein L32 [Corynebacterium lactis]|uniref:Large ribosomal subunit protein bL32 n=1 Tax=Corynebacterium lactis RW2-5 TaxID=1408189 RepID=A0A0K2H1I1_9CORY|nr:50S ribosomal protein L32 [Corynebacterium lactis]ALA67897.1 50S ribosomal protein L32 [Corynebacterium lactis RW2-5]